MTVSHPTSRHRFSLSSAFRRCILSLTGISILLGLPFSYPTIAQAGIFDVLFGGREGRSSASGRRSGGAVRDECPINTTDGQLVDFSAFQALAPDDNRILTTETHPTFWFNLPFAASEDLRHAEFMLIHADDQTYALAEPVRFHLPDQPGIVQFQLPLPKGLERDRTYQWYFSIQCDDDELSRNPVLTGQIQRPAVWPTNELPWPQPLLEAIVAEIPGQQWTQTPEWQELIEAVGLEPAGPVN